jgi:hypothetical protein
MVKVVRAKNVAVYTMDREGRGIKVTLREEGITRRDLPRNEFFSQNETRN